MFSSCGKKDEKKELEEFPVVEIPQKNITGYQRFPAHIEGTVDVEIRPKIDGFLEEIYVDEGQVVKAGDRLFKLETRSLQGEVESSYAQIQSQKANVEAAKIEVEKMRPLVEKGIISDINLKTAMANFAEAQSNLATAYNDYESVKEKQNYQYVTTAVDGVVGSIPYRQGTLVGKDIDKPLTMVSKIDSLYVYFNMSEKDFFKFLRETEGATLQQKIKNFPAISLELPDNSIYSEKGIIQTTTGQINPNTGTATFRAIVSNPGRILNSGNSATVRIPQNYKDVVLVPKQAVSEEQAKLYVFKVVEGDTIKKTLIKSNREIDNVLIVEEGLQRKERVVIAGLTTIKEDIKIKPKPESFDSIRKSIKPVF
tara:strand:+ start:2323 stop:3426 length:1104 start_codon:yes stop_codon:yes gene_type:complete